MTLRDKIADVLERVSFSTAKTVGQEWDALCVEVLDGVQDLEDRLQELETHPALSIPAVRKKR